MAAATTINTDITALQNKRILAYPLTLGGLSKNIAGVDNQFMMVKINTSTKSSTLAGDTGTGPAVSASAIGTGSGQSITQPGSNIQYIDKSTVLQFGDAVKNENWIQKTDMTTLNKVIVLPMPNEYDVGTHLTYDEDYMPSNLVKAGDMLNNAGWGLAKDMARGWLTQKASDAINGISKDATTSEQLLAQQKLIKNPKQEVMYKGYGYRTFNFKYTFAPKSQLESDTIAEIIQTFRYYALPELTDGKQYYIMPGEFVIEFYMGNKINPNIPRMTTSVIKTIDVQYSPGGGIWSTLPNGAPVAVSINMTFLETELVDRSRVYKEGHPVTSGY